MKPLLLDLCCKQGGASKGYVEAGFEVIGVDIEPQPRYPYQFIQADAFDFLEQEDISGFSVIHASPHCQGYTRLNFVGKEFYPKEVEKFREALIKTGKIYVIENVLGSPIQNGVILCGSMFGKYRLQRHRHFESNVYLYEPCKCNHREKSVIFAGHEFNQSQAREIMEIDWMDNKGVANAVPPFYTKFVGTQILQFLEQDKNCSKTY